jgi:hypothetical protein
MTHNTDLDRPPLLLSLLLVFSVSQFHCTYTKVKSFETMKRSTRSISTTGGIIVLLLLLCQTQQVASAPCTPCADPTQSYDPQLAQLEVDVPGLGRLPCSLIAQTAPLLITAESTDCHLLQSLGTYCGCPPTHEFPCQFCDTYDTTAVVTNYIQLDSGEGVSSQCDVVNAYLQSFASDSLECQDFTAQWSPTCGCPSKNGTVVVDISDSEEEGPVSPQLPSSRDAARCALCSNGDGAASTSFDAGKDISSLFRRGGANIDAVFAGFGDVTNLTCGTFSTLMHSPQFPMSLCNSDYHRALAGYCGCPPIENSCVFCPSGDMLAPEQRSTKFQQAEVIYGMDVTCNEMDLALTQFPDTELRCWASKNYAFTCGCNGKEAWYLGAGSKKKHVTLAWIPRISGFLSLLGSLYIIQDILRHNRRNGLSTYHLILLGMSAFDISSSLAWIVSTAALPEFDTERESESGIYGAVGNDATCKIQGFFLELGFVGSTAFSASLTTFYLLSIVYGYRAAKTKPLQKYFLTIPVVLALALASAAIPFYRPLFVACLVSNPNSEVSRHAGNWTYLTVFSILPIGIAVLISVGNLMAICRFVWKTNRKVARWRFPSSTAEMSEEDADGQLADQSGSLRGSTVKPTMSRSSVRTAASRAEVIAFWQAFWYVMAFLLTWVIFIVGQFKPYFSTNDRDLYAFWTTLCLLNPLMGFWNAFVYVKPWTWEWKWTCFRWQRRKENDAADAAEPEAASPRASSGVDIWQASSILEAVYAENGYGTKVKENEPGMETC